MNAPKIRSAPGMDVNRKAATLAASHATDRVRCVRSRVRSTLSATNARSATPTMRRMSSTVDTALFYARMTLTFSRRLALAYGVLLPIVETIRRWQQLGDIRMWPAWLDDFVLGACLLYGAWRTAQDVEIGRPWLAAAWGVTCGMAYTSFFGQLTRLDQPDPSSLPAAWVVGIKGVGFLLAIVALAGSLRHARENSG